MKKAQTDFLKIFEMNAGLIYLSCKKAKIDPKTYYNWLKSSEEFATAITDVKEGFKDYAEGKLYEEIRNGNLTAIIFYLKCKAKDRGYIDRQEIDFSGKQEITIGTVPEYVKDSLDG
jgi:hypothetical protein